MTVNIETLIVEEFIELDGKIVSRIKELRAQGQVKAASQFRIGDVVSFTNKDKLKIIGFIVSTRGIKINIMTEDNEHWTVPASVLTLEQSPSKKLLKLLKTIFPKSVHVGFSVRK